MELSSVYKALLLKHSRAFVQTEHGKIMPLEDWYPTKSGFSFHVYSGAFNPLHAGHKGIFSCMPRTRVWEHGSSGMSVDGMEGIGVFELSLVNFDKGLITLQQLEERLAQFKGYADILITSVATFQQKTGLLRGIRPGYAGKTFFHVGMDTMNRIMQHADALEIQGLGCEFVAYSRSESSGKPIEPIDTFPVNVRMGRDRPEEEKALSSTAIREGRTT
jgi:hypothetical protein